MSYIELLTLQFTLYTIITSIVCTYINRKKYVHKNYKNKKYIHLIYDDLLTTIIIRKTFFLELIPTYSKLIAVTDCLAATT